MNRNFSSIFESKNDFQIQEVELFPEFGILLIYNELYFYGNNANEEISQRITQDIETSWNEPNASILINEIEYQVQFIFKAFFTPELTQEQIKNNQFVWKKFFRVEKSSKLHVSFVDGIHSNSGYFMLKNVEKPNSKTGAHEIGHSFGLVHPDNLDYRGKGRPHIMYPRGTLVDKEFQYKPDANLLVIDGKLTIEPGATIDTDKRCVMVQNILELNLDKLTYIHNQATLSKLSNKYHDEFMV